MGKAIIIQGTPGTGKSTIAERLSKKLGIKHIDISRLVIEEKLYVEVDRERSDSKVANIDKLTEKIVNILENSGKDVIVEGHYADIIPEKYVKKAIIIRLHPEILEKRLRMRGWSEKKVRENVLSEALDECLISALQTYGIDKVVEIDATNKNVEEILREILDELEGKNRKHVPGRIDWLKIIEAEGKLEEFLKRYSKIREE
ncbi:MAG: adenylate kinase family protein [archaeon GB-1845-036]|nr:adenylate kinase family protein [Candidatus Culexmicrobium thermophilum]HDO20088.1 AAA family ATPase [Candidatus Bathyarchaeota archaeon]